MRTDDFNKLSQEERLRALDIMHSIERVFSTEDGRKVLQHWKDKHVNVSYSKPDKSNEERMFNAGKADFVLDIQKAIEASKKVR